jgi:uncharacterized protein YbjT (DUF2867 family)
MSMRIAVAGSSGFVGSALVPALVASGHTVKRLARGIPDPRALDGVDGVVNLAGESVDER